MARVKVSHTAATVIAEGPGSVILRNNTGTDPVFLEVGAAQLPGGAPKPVASESTGYEWKTADGPLVLSLANGAVLTGIAKAAEQEVMVLRDGPR